MVIIVFGIVIWYSFWYYVLVCSSIRIVCTFRSLLVLSSAAWTGPTVSAAPRRLLRRPRRARRAAGRLPSASIFAVSPPERLSIADYARIRRHSWKKLLDRRGSRINNVLCYFLSLFVYFASSNCFRALLVRLLFRLPSASRSGPPRGGGSSGACLPARRPSEPRDFYHDYLYYC